MNINSLSFCLGMPLVSKDDFAGFKIWGQLVLLSVFKTCHPTAFCYPVFQNKSQ